MVFDLWFQTCQAHQSDLVHSQCCSKVVLFVHPPPQFPINLSTSASHNPNPWMGFLSFRKPSIFCRNCSCFEPVCFLSSACIRLSKEAMAWRGFQTTAIDLRTMSKPSQGPILCLLHACPPLTPPTLPVPASHPSPPSPHPCLRT